MMPPPRRRCDARLAAVLCLACAFAACSDDGPTPEEKEALSAAQGFLVELAAGRMSGWDLTDGRLFGHGLDKGEGPSVVRIPGPTDTSRAGDVPLRYGVRLSVWCRGSATNGESIKRRRLVLVVVARPGTGSWSMERHEVLSDEPLGFWAQATQWLVITYMVPFWVVVITMNWNNKLGCGLVAVALLCTVPLSAYAGYVCFGSAGAGIAGFLVNLVPLGLVSSWLGRVTT